MARQQAARSKSVRFGKLKTHFVTKSGKVVKNPKPDGYDEKGRPIHSAKNLVKVVLRSGTVRIMDAREVAVLITKKTIRVQSIGPA